MQVTQKQLIELLRMGRAPLKARAAAARAALPLRPGAMLESLDLLADDTDPAIQAEAQASLDRFPEAELLAVAGSASTSPELLDRLARRYRSRAPVARAIAANPGVPRSTAAFLAAAAHPVPDAGDEGGLFAPVLVEEEPDDGEGTSPPAETDGARNARQASIFSLLKQMSMGQKVALAVKGNRDVRNILIRDTNKMLCLKVLENPRIGDSDVEAYAKSTNVSEDVLRGIALRKEWCKKYPVVKALVLNPKAPLGISLDLVKRLTLKDLEQLAKNRNVPETLRSTSRKMLELKRQANH